LDISNTVCIQWIKSRGNQTTILPYSYTENYVGIANVLMTSNTAAFSAKVIPSTVSNSEIYFETTWANNGSGYAAYDIWIICIGY